MIQSTMIHVGTCSWTELTLIKSHEFYPSGVDTAEVRLRYYASHFSTVEVDSAYYAIPITQTTSLWAQRTPEKFTFHIKVYGALTGHPVDPKTLPKDIAALLSARDREEKRVFINEPALLQAIAERFREALTPLLDAGWELCHPECKQAHGAPGDRPANGRVERGAL